MRFLHQSLEESFAVSVKDLQGTVIRAIRRWSDIVYADIRQQNSTLCCAQHRIITEWLCTILALEDRRKWHLTIVRL